ncbi:hypothetical protein [Herpetosiphon llansteffanensis]|uniref:hypothetical protein n=1 Tax=Herpetosiphon llansteffanensis TaxID=2094568 RepID=UPI000D7BC395|nr:hypothetical protein [Herpetosiphon llansteffanensis]
MLKKQPQPYHTEAELIAEETVLKLLSENDPSAQSSLYEPLRQRLFQQHPTTKPILSFRFALIVTCVLLALLTLTPVRSSLAAVLERFGIIQITDDPSIVQELQGQPLAGLELTPAPTGVFSEIDSSVQTISKQIGAHVYFTNQLPDGYLLADRVLDVGPKGSTVITYYINTEDTVNNDAGSIEIRQIYQPDPNIEPYDLAIGAAASTSVQVRGFSGLWIEQAPLLLTDDGTGHFTILPANALVWSEGANTFQLQSDRLDLAAMQAIAESLR